VCDFWALKSKEDVMLKPNKVVTFLFALFLILNLSACAVAPTATSTPILPTATPTTPDPTVTPVPATPTPLALPTFTPLPPTATAIPTPTIPPQPTATPAPAKDDVVAWKLVSEPPTPGKWIDVNLSDGFVRLMEGRKLFKALPGAWGYGVTGTESDYFSTAPGMYFVYSRYNYRWYDAQYSQTYIYSFVGFDPERSNGFHSFLYDAKGNVTDNRLGAISHGCIRVEDWKAVHDFSAIGMIVMIHASPLPDMANAKP
jgi:L,D-transpeptidase catalytic domain